MAIINCYGLDNRSILFQDDIYLKNNVTITKKWLEDNEINVLKWPAQTPKI